MDPWLEQRPTCISDGLGSVILDSDGNGHGTLHIVGALGFEIISFSKSQMLLVLSFGKMSLAIIDINPINGYFVGMDQLIFFGVS